MDWGCFAAIFAERDFSLQSRARQDSPKSPLVRSVYSEARSCGLAARLYRRRSRELGRALASISMASSKPLVVIRAVRAPFARGACWCRRGAVEEKLARH